MEEEEEAADGFDGDVASTASLALPVVSPRRPRVATDSPPPSVDAETIGASTRKMIAEVVVVDDDAEDEVLGGCGEGAEEPPISSLARLREERLVPAVVAGGGAAVAPLDAAADEPSAAAAAEGDASSRREFRCIVLLSLTVDHELSLTLLHSLSAKRVYVCVRRRKRKLLSNRYRDLSTCTCNEEVK